MTTSTDGPRPDILLHRWLTTLPGMFEGDDSMAAIAASYRAAGVERFCTVAEWQDALERSGFRPQPVRDRYRLVFPEKSPGQVGRVYHG